jgi:hypothetical protein
MHGCNDRNTGALILYDQAVHVSMRVQQSPGRVPMHVQMFRPNTSHGVLC